MAGRRNRFDVNGEPECHTHCRRQRHSSHRPACRHHCPSKWRDDCRPRRRRKSVPPACRTGCNHAPRCRPGIDLVVARPSTIIVGLRVELEIDRTAIVVLERNGEIVSLRHPAEAGKSQTSGQNQRSLGRHVRHSKRSIGQLIYNINLYKST